MFHKNVSNPQFNISPVPNQTPTQKSTGLSLVPSLPQPTAERSAETLKPRSSLLDLAVIAARRCSSFFAEAAVLVLVFGILDFFMLKGRIDLSWIIGAFAISLSLLALSVAMDFTAHRWIKAHP
jgi:hypothetical protein